MQEDGIALPEGFEISAKAAAKIDYEHYTDPHLLILPVEVGGRSLRINVTIDEGLVSRVDRLAARVHASRSAILARGARLVLASENVD